MDKLTKEEVLHTAKLANIIIEEKDIEKYQITLKSVFDEIEKINEIEGYDEERMISPCNHYITFRSDDSNNSNMLTNDEVMKNVPRKNGNFIETVGVIND